MPVLSHIELKSGWNNPNLDGSLHPNLVDLVSQLKMDVLYCITQICMILNILVSHLKATGCFVYIHAILIMLSKNWCFAQSNFRWLCIIQIWYNSVCWCSSVYCITKYLMQVTQWCRDCLQMQIFYTKSKYFVHILKKSEQLSSLSMFRQCSCIPVDYVPFETLVIFFGIILISLIHFWW